MNEKLRNPQVEAERINVPAIMPICRRYRMHLGLDQLAAADGFNRMLESLLRSSGR